MRATAVAGVVTSACLLASCGFVPPAPPMPDNSLRVAINKADPRLSWARPSSGGSFQARNPTSEGATASSGGMLPIPVPEAPPSAPAPPSTPAVANTSATSQAPAQAVAATDTPAAPAAVASVAEPPAAPAAANANPPAATGTGSAEAKKPEAAPASGTDSEPNVIPEAVPDAEPEPAPEPAVVTRTWRIGPDDKTVRQALARWTKEEGWTFTPERWEVPFDLPVEASAEFVAPTLEEAVQDLSEAIALTESPVRPCFYANRVLRIIPYNQSCDRGGAPLQRR